MILITFQKYFIWILILMHIQSKEKLYLYEGTAPDMLPWERNASMGGLIQKMKTQLHQMSKVLKHKTGHFIMRKLTNESFSAQLFREILTQMLSVHLRKRDGEETQTISEMKQLFSTRIYRQLYDLIMQRKILSIKSLNFQYSFHFSIDFFHRCCEVMTLGNYNCCSQGKNTSLSV